MKITTKQITTTAVLLAICIMSQYFKSMSPYSQYITGPIVNATLIIATLLAGLMSGVVISIISPITAFFFTGSPIMAGIPLMFPLIMAGNMIIVFFTYFFSNKAKFPFHLEIGLVLGSIVKATFMGLLVIYIIFPNFGNNIGARLPKPEALPKVLEAAKITFSITQLITALLGSALAYIILNPLKKVIQKEL